MPSISLLLISCQMALDKLFPHSISFGRCFFRGAEASWFKVVPFVYLLSTYLFSEVSALKMPLTSYHEGLHGTKSTAGRLFVFVKNMSYLFHLHIAA